mgnify:CR=1 FL=1
MKIVIESDEEYDYIYDLIRQLRSSTDDVYEKMYKRIEVKLCNAISTYKKYGLKVKP